MNICKNCIYWKKFKDKCFYYWEGKKRCTKYLSEYEYEEIEDE